MASALYVEKRSFIFSGDYTRNTTLLAGDSNVHRIMAAIPSGSSINCLPVSGARIVNDVKGFSRSLRTELEKVTYDQVYLHLGANDILCQQGTFYKNVCELCDMVHQVSPSSHIVLCEVPPRGPDMRRGVRLSKQKLLSYRCWINEANDTLLEMSNHIPYMKFLYYRGISSVSHLSRDGLHLNPAGAELCQRAICNYIAANVPSLQLSQVCSLEEDCFPASWPRLDDNEPDAVDTMSEESGHKSYAAVARMNHAVEVPKENLSKQDCSEKNPTAKVIVKVRRKARYFRRQTRKTSNRLCKMFVRKRNARRLSDALDCVTINVTDDVAIELKACKIMGSCMGRHPQRSVTSSQKSATTKSTNDYVVPDRKKGKMVWLSCPDCQVKCSRDDFLLDHIIRRHGSHFYKPEEKRVRPSRNICIPPAETEESPKSVDPICSDLYSSQHTCEELQLDIQEDADTARLCLLLSNDVEQNPGPTYTCNWDECSMVFSSIGELDFHIIQHVSKDRVCKWAGCDVFKSDLASLEVHALQHLYNKEFFPSIEDWYRSLPSGQLNEKTTNLQLCPRHLRSKLMFLLFDEDFVMQSNTYTADDHQLYLERLSIQYPFKFNVMKDTFLQKRMSLGENWVNTSTDSLENSSRLASTCSSNISSIQRPIYTTVSNIGEYDRISTSRPELATNFFSGTELRKPIKRKHSSCFGSTWSESLMNNLSSCCLAMKIENSILQIMSDKDLVTSSQPSFFKLEQEAARLSSLKDCCSGSFVYNVFKCTIEDREIYYIRYFESGVYLGFMLQRYLYILKNKFDFTDDTVLLHNTITTEDIKEMTLESSVQKVKRYRPNKIYKYSVENVMLPATKELQKIKNCPEIKLESSCVHVLPFKSKVTVDNPADMFLELSRETCSYVDFKSYLLDFRLHKLNDENDVSSKNIFKEPIVAQKNLLQQSITMNCLSGNIKRKPNLFKRSARFESNFPFNVSVASSLRNRTINFYLNNDYSALISFFVKYFPELNGSSVEGPEVEISNVTPATKKRKRQPHRIQGVVVTKKDLESQLISDSISSESSSTIPINIFDNFCCMLLDHGKMAIQSCDDNGALICCLNDYSDIDASFKHNDFVYTARLPQEVGDYFYCSCNAFNTLINLKNCAKIHEDFIVLDAAGDNCVTCMHCKFLKKMVMPAIRSGNVETRMDQFVADALKYKGKDIIEISRFRDTRKYIVLVEGDDMPVFVHLTYNQRTDNYIVSCLNGKCRSLRGHKKNVTYLTTSNVCKHLAILKQHTEFWQDLLDNQSAINIPSSNSFIDDNTTEDNNNLNLNTDTADTEDENFNASTGLWYFKCKSTHSPLKKDNAILKHNVLARDKWNDDNLQRYSDGCLKGPSLFPDIPEDTCSCSAGWLKREDDHQFSENGITVNEKKRLLTIYTQFAPVKCEIHYRICYSSENQCKLFWDEGQSIGVHVLSRDTAAGDEIGWEFVSMVINSGITFSSFCQLKTETYRLRNDEAKFMDSKVFINWWFSWAASMKIDFRKPCDVCGFEPKRLCCDGTRVGVGFRHANYVEINTTIPNSLIQSTLHRRMDRCFLKNMNGINKQQMIANRTTLDYLARREIGDLDDKDTINPAELDLKIDSVKTVLPLEVLPSFERFFTMTEFEKLAYAHVLKMLSSTASITSLLPPSFCTKLQEFVNNPESDGSQFNIIMNEMRTYAPELRDLICESMLCHENILPNDIRLLLQYLINESLCIDLNEPEPAIPQPETYNPAKFGTAYYFNESGLKLRNCRKYTIDNDNNARRNNDHDDDALEFERCQKIYSKIQHSAPGTSNLFLWFCADHGHCYGFHMTGAEGRKDPAASLYSYLEKPPQDIFYDFACNLQEYCLNRESGFYKNVRFFHDIFHGYAHKCSSAFKSSRLQGFESVNSEICEQFNSFIQCIKKSARQMSQTHFCFYLQFFLHEWNERKKSLYKKKIRIALAGLV